MTNDKGVTNLAKDLTLGDHKIIFCYLFWGGERSECFGCRTVSSICTSRLSEEKKHKFLSIMKHSGYIVWFE